ncbi:MAG: hypothetical protein U5N26_08000 [Candidatus Marinimicrobia bacterium]|nr:hypothetical protein [Candidatus Neomarinimicrobiota bacterium]
MAQKHMSKKELKEDPFFEEVTHVITFFQKHHKKLLGIGLIVAIGLSTFFITKNVMKTKNTEAVGYFGIAMDRYNKNQFRQAEEQFLFVAEEYPNTDWGERAYYYLGMVSRALDRPDTETLRYLENFLNANLDDAALRASANQLVATYYYRNGDVVTAGNHYLGAAKNAFSKATKIEYGIRSLEAFVEAEDVKGRDKILKYLNTLDLNETEQNRVDALAKL